MVLTTQTFCTSTMSAYFSTFLCLLVTMHSAHTTQARGIGLNNSHSESSFEDYLLNISLGSEEVLRDGRPVADEESYSDRVHPEAHEERDQAVGGADDTPTGADGRGLSDDTPIGADGRGLSDDSENSESSEQLLEYFKRVPRQHWSCCMLGMLAGNKGFHCQPHFYATPSSLRNFNRAQTARQPAARGRDRTVAHWGYGIMRTFRRCVTHQADEFHNCCFAARTERRELTRARQYRQRTK